MQRDEIDVARIIQLSRAVLAHGDQDEARAFAGVARIRQNKAAGAVGVAQHMLGGERDRGIRETRQGFGDLIEHPDAAEIGKGDEKRHALARMAQRRHDRGVIRRRARRRDVISSIKRLEMTLRRLGERLEKPIGMVPAMRERKGE